MLKNLKILKRFKSSFTQHHRLTKTIEKSKIINSAYLQKWQDLISYQAKNIPDPVRAFEHVPTEVTVKIQKALSNPLVLLSVVAEARRSVEAFAEFLKFIKIQLNADIASGAKIIVFYSTLTKDTSLLKLLEPYKRKIQQSPVLVSELKGLNKLGSKYNFFSFKNFQFENVEAYKVVPSSVVSQQVIMNMEKLEWDSLNNIAHALDVLKIIFRKS